ncbi:uncharacterized protein A1O9_13113 [Exophiala aquamarina CBS 119918]|uniref:O-methyltransferase C-terminal domain-containing protein n=1 Tax=Exophiala aquamarina CBS 119918 TaxID=1182545 RepID=A0A072NTA4_9EURO|nr:uncharacterized protein A1O9_13113 [Exophiala aquamarina CBS 119918]KEF50836.1 hypothetical protein A1O9_13113 [Exophiala aquamarina CBS 119918]
MPTTPTPHGDCEISDLAGQIAHLSQVFAHCTLEPQHEGTGRTLNETTNDPPSIRQALIVALNELLVKVQGPTRALIDMTNTSRVRLAAMRVVTQFDLAASVPETGAISVRQLASIAAVDPFMLERVLRFAFSQGIFQEETPGSGEVSHTELSRAIPVLAPWIRWVLSPITVLPDLSLPDALESSLSPGGGPSAAHLAFQRGFWDELRSRPPSEVAAFQAGLRSLSHAQTLCREGGVEDDVFRWEALENTLVIDVGGGDGQSAIEGAKRNPAVHFLVQDLEENHAKFLQIVPQDLSERVTFRVHDFFDPQPPAGPLPVTVFMKWVLHNWSHRQCVQILTNVLPLLTRTGSRLLIADYLLSDGAHIRAIDVTMMTLFGSGERTLGDIETMLGDVDKGSRSPRCGIRTNGT